MSDGIPSLEALSDLAERILECATEELTPERTTLEVTGYADGDYRVRAFETVGAEADPDRGTVFERLEVRYNRNKEWIELRRVRESDDGRAIAEVSEIEPYADPVASGQEG